MARSMLSQLQRNLYLASRTAGDLQAVKRGRLGPRLVRRAERRTIWRLLRRAGL
jgi:hypothetical protein